MKRLPFNPLHSFLLATLGCSSLIDPSHYKDLKYSGHTTYTTNVADHSKIALYQNVWTLEGLPQAECKESPAMSATILEGRIYKHMMQMCKAEDRSDCKILPKTFEYRDGNCYVTGSVQGIWREKSPQEVAHVHKLIAEREQKIRNLGARYQKFLADRKATEQRSAAIQSYSHMLADNFLGSTINTESVFTRKEYRLSDEATSIISFYHECHHLMSSLILDAFTLGDGNFDQHMARKGKYTYYRTDGTKRIDYVPGTLGSHEIYKEFAVKKELEPIARTYFQNTFNNFYIFLDEWNAYLAGLEIQFDLEREIDTSEEDVSGFPEKTKAWAVAISMYLDRLKKERRKVYDLVTRNAGIRNFVLDLLKETEEKLAHTKTQMGYKVHGDELEAEFPKSAANIRKHLK